MVVSMAKPPSQCHRHHLFIHGSSSTQPSVTFGKIFGGDQVLEVLDDAHRTALGIVGLAQEPELPLRVSFGNQLLF